MGSLEQISVVEDSLADPRRELHVTDDEELLDVAFVGLLLRHEAFPDMLHEHFELDLKQPFGHSARLLDSFLGLLKG